MRPSRVRPGWSCAARTQPHDAPRRRPRPPLPCAPAPPPAGGVQDTPPPAAGAAGTRGSSTPRLTALPIGGPGEGEGPPLGVSLGETEAGSSREEGWGLEGAETMAGR